MAFCNSCGLNVAPLASKLSTPDVECVSIVCVMCVICIQCHNNHPFLFLQLPSTPAPQMRMILTFVLLALVLMATLQDANGHPRGGGGRGHRGGRHRPRQPAASAEEAGSQQDSSASHERPGSRGGHREWNRRTRGQGRRQGQVFFQPCLLRNRSTEEVLCNATLSCPDFTQCGHVVADPMVHTFHLLDVLFCIPKVGIEVANNKYC